MAATDQTYRNIRATHVVFGVSCVLMLGSVLWMCYQDYNREYKPIQRTFRDVEEGRNLRVMLEQLPRERVLGVVLNRAERQPDDTAYYYQSRYQRQAPPLETGLEEAADDEATDQPEMIYIEEGFVS